MSDLTPSERHKLEEIFQMNEGYVLQFNDQTFSEFFARYDVGIDNERYRKRGNSKAKRMRMHWELDSNYVVGRVINGMIDDASGQEYFRTTDPVAIANCRKIAQRLLSDQPVAEIEALAAPTDERDFEVVAEQIREAIEKNQPEAALDRLHTYLIKFVRMICEPYRIEVTKEKPLHSLFGEYVRAIKEAGYIESTMTERILKSSISVLDQFNSVRNDKSLAHDNPILNYEESLLIFNHIAALVRFLKALEIKIKDKSQLSVKSTTFEINDLPF